MSKAQAFKAAQVNSVLSVSSDYKTIKGESRGYLTGILYMLSHTDGPESIGQKGTLCPNAVNAGCSMACLVSAGRGSFNSVIEGRRKRAVSFLTSRDAFMVALWHDVVSLSKKAKKAMLVPCVRLNGTSDIDYTKIIFTAPDGKTANIFNHFPDIQFYDYSKNVHYKLDTLPGNYSVTVSYSEYNMQYADRAYKQAVKYNTGLAVVFSKSLPQYYKGLPVINADNDDLRFDDKRKYNIHGAYIAGLKAKGKARKDTSGFVVDNVNSNYILARG